MSPAGPIRLDSEGRASIVAVQTTQRERGEPRPDRAEQAQTAAAHRAATRR
jgi:hypothetical protein